MSHPRVTLTPDELLLAAIFGSLRNIDAWTKGYEPLCGDVVGDPATWGRNIEGVAGEMAVAKHLNIYWKPISGDPKADDVGPYQVRTNSSRKHTHLCLRPHDRPDRVYISVLSFIPHHHEIVGWLWGSEGMIDDERGWYRVGTPGLPKCFYVPMAALHPMAELPTREELGK
jgi:hypothetical protein